MEEKKTESFYILGYLLELIIKIWQSGNCFLEIWIILAIFSMENPLRRLKSYFSGRNFGKNFAQKEKHWSSATLLLKLDRKPLIHFSPSLVLVEKPYFFGPRKQKWSLEYPGNFDTCLLNE